MTKDADDTAAGRPSPNATDFRKAPVDDVSRDRLASDGLHLDLVDTSDQRALGIWLQAEDRGFLEPIISDERLAAALSYAAENRTTGVWDSTVAGPESPVATTASWLTQLTVPGETSVAAWAISSVTVSPTHRRRGIARALLEAELRTAHSLGVPIAMLTVTEATIYGRYGFGPAAYAADWTIETKRVKWIGPTPAGRTHFVSAGDLLVDGLDLAEVARLVTPGQMEIPRFRWEHLLGVASDPERAKNLRFVRYDDIDGVAQGFVGYRLIEIDGDFTKHRLEVAFLLSATDDAYAALWRFVTEMDLVATVSAPLRSLDEPFAWQLSDVRALKSSARDHLWTRILDVPTALEARRYGAADSIILDVSDDLGFADGLFLVRIADDGSATVENLDGEAPDAAAAVALTAADLGSLYLGGVSATTLVRAGRVTELRPGSAERVDVAFRSAVVPWLSIWF